MLRVSYRGADGALRVPINSNFFADLLLRLPSRSTLTVVLTACEPAPLVLFRTWLSLHLPGFARDFVGTLPETDHARNCPVFEDDDPIERTCRRLACGHTFHEACLRRWFRVRRTCPVCGWKVEGSRDRGCDTVNLPTATGADELTTPLGGKMSLKSIRDEICRYLNRHHHRLFYTWVWSLIFPGREEEEEAGDVIEYDISTVLLKLPYQSTLDVIFTLFECRPETLRKFYDNATCEDGFRRDVTSTLPRTDRVLNCTKLDPLYWVPEEGGRVLECGHSFHETCLRYWFRVRKDCPVCKRRVNIKEENAPRRLNEKKYVKSNLDGVTLHHMRLQLQVFLFCRYGVDCTSSA